jgi:hypothetical protein
VSAAFKVSGDYSTKETVFKTTTAGKVNKLSTQLDVWPTEVKLSINGTNNWGFWKIIVKEPLCGKVYVLKKDLVNGEAGVDFGDNDPARTYWLKGSEAGLSHVKFVIPPAATEPCENSTRTKNNGDTPFLKHRGKGMSTGLMFVVIFFGLLALPLAIFLLEKSNILPPRTSGPLFKTPGPTRATDAVDYSYPVQEPAHKDRL